FDWSRLSPKNAAATSHRRPPPRHRLQDESDEEDADEVSSPHRTDQTQTGAGFSQAVDPLSGADPPMPSPGLPWSSRPSGATLCTPSNKPEAKHQHHRFSRGIQRALADDSPFGSTSDVNANQVEPFKMASKRQLSPASHGRKDGKKSRLHAATGYTGWNRQCDAHARAPSPDELTDPQFNPPAFRKNVEHGDVMNEDSITEDVVEGPLRYHHERDRDEDGDAFDERGDDHVDEEVYVHVPSVRSEISRDRRPNLAGIGEEEAASKPSTSEASLGPPSDESRSGTDALKRLRWEESLIKRKFVGTGRSIGALLSTTSSNSTATNTRAPPVANGRFPDLANTSASSENDQTVTSRARILREAGIIVEQSPLRNLRACESIVHRLAEDLQKYQAELTKELELLGDDEDGDPELSGVEDYCTG
ncbi:hypothetical protein HDU93_009658, partial [Gonapodya sp. JEL0774]